MAGSDHPPRRGIPLGGHRPVGRGAAQTSGCKIPTGRHGQATRGGHRGRGGRGRGSIPALSIPTSRSLEHDPHSASPSPSIPSVSSVPSTSSSRTIPNCPLQSPSPTSRHDTPVPTRPAPPATASPTASPYYDGRARLQVTGPPRAPQRTGIEPPRVQRIPITLIADDTELHPSHSCARRMTKVFKRWMIPEGYSWKSVPNHHKDHYWRQWKGTNMLSRLLHVRLPTAKQAVITAIDLLGCAVITAAESGASFPLKRRDLMLDYILTLMGREESDGYPGSNLELLHTQVGLLLDVIFYLKTYYLFVWLVNFLQGQLINGEVWRSFLV
ncbi:hypothetical protein Scep_017193 [Stephania cephalantha]|uniref:Uncharacterized protein n=2 Tax=Stephania TaxID=147243 RepID=A0AAP0IQ07_9MAGN